MAFAARAPVAPAKAKPHGGMTSSFWPGMAGEGEGGGALYGQSLLSGQL